MFTGGWVPFGLELSNLGRTNVTGQERSEGERWLGHGVNAHYAHNVMHAQAEASLKKLITAHMYDQHVHLSC